MEPEKKPEASAYPRPAYAWYVVVVLMIAYISSFIDRQILSLLVDDIRRDLAISEFQMSLLMGFSFAIFYTILGLPIGRLADRHSRRNIIVVGVLIWSLMTAACGLVKNYVQFFLARVGVGVGEAALSPAAYSMIADYFPKRKLATAMSVYSMGIYLGSGLALLLGGFVAELAEKQRIWELPLVGEVYSWQMVFFMVGLPGLLIALLLLTVKEPERRLTGYGQKKTASLQDLYQYFKENRQIVLRHNFGFALLTVSTYSGGYWIPAFLMRNFGWSKIDVGLTYGLSVTVFATIGIVCGGRLADYLVNRGYINGRQIVILIALIGLLILVTIFPFLATEQNVILFLIPIPFFSSFGVGTGTAVVQEVTPPLMRAQASAFFLFIVNIIGLGMGPSIVALVTQYVFADDQAVGYSLALVSSVALSLAAILIASSMQPYRESLAKIAD